MNTKINEVENKIPHTSSLVATTVLNTKISEVENKIPNHDKYITTSKFNKLKAETFYIKIKASRFIDLNWFYEKTSKL